MHPLPPRDSLELSSLRDGSRRDIPWDADVAPLSDARRAKLVHAWTWRREQEHLAVGGFARLSYEAAAHGCEPATLALLTRAATDEVPHADVCRRVVEKHLGAPLPTAMRGAPEPDAPLRGRPTEASARALLLRIVETCCVSETMTGVYFTEMLEVATHPLGRAVVLSLLEDEVDHGRVGWAYLAAACRDGLAGAVADELPGILESHVAFVFDDAVSHPEADDPELDQHGYVGRARAADIYRHGLRTVVLPGFDALDLDTRAARDRLAARGWI
ncbi:MAG: hypothetical protein U0414_35200 [Polyangiaceae bacterium]